MHLDGEPFGDPAAARSAVRSRRGPRRRALGRHADDHARCRSRFASGARLHGAGGRRIGTVDAVFADYLLVRTAGLLPVDLYVPRPEVTVDGDRLSVDVAPARRTSAGTGR